MFLKLTTLKIKRTFHTSHGNSMFSEPQNIALIGGVVFPLARPMDEFPQWRAAVPEWIGSLSHIPLVDIDPQRRLFSHVQPESLLQDSWALALQR